MKTVRLWLEPIEGDGANPPERNRAGKAAAEYLLHCVLHVQEADLPRNEHGKPELAAGELKFNLSHHSGSYAVLAVSDMEVGVDIEPAIRRKIPVPKRFLRQDELDWLGENPSSERFATLWTRLEAALKADGRGFDLEHRDFSVVDSGQPWFLHTFIHDGHVISCAAAEPFEVKVTKLSAENLLK